MNENKIVDYGTVDGDCSVMRINLVVDSIEELEKDLIKIEEIKKYRTGLVFEINVDVVKTRY